MLTLLLFIARVFISGGFQAAYVYTPEVRGWEGMPGSSGGEWGRWREKLYFQKHEAWAPLTEICPWERLKKHNNL